MFLSSLDFKSGADFGYNYGISAKHMSLPSREIVISPKTFGVIDLAEIIRFRELFYIFSWRDIKVRYKQTLLGVIWVIFQPLVTTLIFTVFFGNLAKIPSGDMPYPLFVLTGLVFWNYFSNSVTHAANSMVENESIIKKVYFPKIILPLSSLLTGFIDFLINLSLLFLFAIATGHIPNLKILYLLPFSLLVTIFSSAGLGLFLASINVKYRDVRYILPFFIQILLFISPVIYPLSILSPSHKIYMAFNPMSGAVEAARGIFSGTPPDFSLMIVSAFSSLLILFTGFIYFSKTERFFADIV